MRNAALDMTAQQFRALGHELVDRLADFLDGIRERPLTAGETPSQVRAALGAAPLPESGADPAECLRRAQELLIDHSLLNGHPRFWGYVSGSAAPIGALADLLVSAINPNAGAWILSPMATEIEIQTIRWIAEFLGYPSNCGGLLVSGGNMANFIGFLCARRAKAPWDIRAAGIGARDAQRLTVYASTETHTWIQKAADLFGLGTSSIRWIPTSGDFCIDPGALRAQIETDRAEGCVPLLVVGNAGTVSTGAVDPLDSLAAIAREYGMWFHVDGAYGAPAAAIDDGGPDLKALSFADSIAVDPHKWLYAPLEAGCALVRDPVHLRDTFDYSPAYYRFGAGEEEPPLNYYSYGPQNSRGSRAVKIWLALQAAGRRGMARMIGDDIALARQAFEAIAAHPRLQAFTHSLSIVTFRYVPAGVDADDDSNTEHLNAINQQLLDRIQQGGEAFVSNAVIRGRFVLRLCIVNFRTTLADVQALPAIIAKLGAEIDASEPRPSGSGVSPVSGDAKPATSAQSVES
jgi:glutamate/tyrosine decarboxylase-like PLP-dependent enzyme